MDELAILGELSRICRDVIGDPGITLTFESTAEDIRGWDSLNHIAIIVEAERRFGVKFLTPDIQDLKDVRDFVRAIESRRADHRN